jgi:hypothetical protein
MIALPDAKAHTTHAFVSHPFVLAFLVHVSLPALPRLMSEAQSLRPLSSLTTAIHINVSVGGSDMPARKPEECACC